MNSALNLTLPATDVVAYISAHLEPLGYGILESRFTRNPRPKIDLVVELLDGSPVTLVACQEAHRLTADFLAHDVRTLPYAEAALSISSPGLERPLITPRDYKRSLGHSIRVTVQQEAALVTWVGSVTYVNENGVGLERAREGLIELPWDILKNGHYVI